LKADPQRLTSGNSASKLLTCCTTLSHIATCSNSAGHSIVLLFYKDISQSQHATMCNYIITYSATKVELLCKLNCLSCYYKYILCKSTSRKNMVNSDVNTQSQVRVLNDTNGCEKCCLAQACYTIG